MKIDQFCEKMSFFANFWSEIYQKSSSCIIFQLCALQNDYIDIYTKIIVTKPLENSKIAQCAIFVRGYPQQKHKNANISSYE